MEQKISTLTCDGQSHFVSLIEALKAAGDGIFRDEASNVTEELARFRLWANNIGAANSGIASLDYRLRNAEYLCKSFEKLLNNLSETLISGFTPSKLAFADIGAAILVTGEGDTTVEMPDEELPSEMEHDFSASSDEASSTNVSSPGQSVLQRRQKNFQGCIDEVVSSIDNLFDISIFIRGASRSFRRDRAILHLEANKDGESVLSQFHSLIALKIDVLCREGDTPHWLKERVTRLITVRRQQFYYQRAHASHLAGNTPLSPRKEERVMFGSKPNVAKERTSESSLQTSPARNPSLSRVPTSDSKTTIFSKATTAKVEEHPAASPRRASVTPSEIRLRENLFPNPPTEPHNKAFICNQCFYPQPPEVRDDKAWREHLFTDLRPYCCTFEKCPDPDQLFETRDEWLEHEMQHRQEWLCDICHDNQVPVLVFPTENEFRKHLFQEHFKSLPEPDESFLVTRAKRPSLFPFKKCPFCATSEPDLTGIENLYEISDTEYKYLKVSYELQKHIGTHLVNFSHLAFLESDDGDEDAISDASHVPQSRSHLIYIDWDSEDDLFNPEINPKELMDDVSELESDVEWGDIPLQETIPPQEDPLLRLFSKPTLAENPSVESTSKEPLETQSPHSDSESNEGEEQNPVVMDNFPIRLESKGYILQGPASSLQYVPDFVQVQYTATLIPRSASHAVHFDRQTMQKFTETPFPDGTHVYRSYWIDIDGLAILRPHYPLSLRQIISPQLQLTERQWLQIMLGIVNRLVITHEAGLPHGDLSPSNIVLQLPVNGKYDPYRMHIHDFGIYFLTQLVDSSGRPFLVPGGIEYMSPELRNLKRIDPNTMSDMWAVGAIGYEMTMGQEMDAATAVFQPLEKYYRGQDLDLSQVPERFSPHVHEIIRRCLRRNPNERYTAPELFIHIRQLLPMNRGKTPATFMRRTGWT